MPPLYEQQKIADYLDTQCAEIDTVLEKTRAGIEEYKKLKQSVITKAVTKGIRGPRPMKDSGVEWIGEIPEKWGIASFKRFARVRMGETILSVQTDHTGIPIYSATQDDSIFGYIKECSLKLHRNDLVIPARGNSIGCATIIKENIATCTQTTICATQITGANYKYLYYCCWSFKKIWFKYEGSAIPQITVAQVNNNILTVPPLYEQTEIADYLDAKCAEIDTLIAKKEQLITELEAYKKSLIYEYVTGKKEVPAT